MCQRDGRDAEQQWDLHNEQTRQPIYNYVKIEVLRIFNIIVCRVNLQLCSNYAFDNVSNQVDGGSQRHGSATVDGEAAKIATTEVFTLDLGLIQIQDAVTGTVIGPGILNLVVLESE